MVDPAGIVTATSAINDHAAAQRKIKRMPWVIGVDRMPGIGFFRADAQAPVVQKGGFCRNGPDGEYPFAMQGRFAHHMPGGDRAQGLVGDQQGYGSVCQQ